MENGSGQSPLQLQDVAGYFDSLSANWSRNYGGGGGMAERIDWFTRSLAAEGVAIPAPVLDFGCGSGEIARALARQGYAVSACDISRGMLETARRARDGHLVEWTQLPDVPEAPLPFNAAAFDAVLSSSVFEYVAQPGPLMTRLAAVIRPGCVFVFTVPDSRHPVRQSEERWLRRMEQLPWSAFVRWLPARLPGRVRYEYLRLSVNRWPAEAWVAALAAAGFTARPIPPCDGPLLMVTARRTT